MIKKTIERIENLEARQQLIINHLIGIKGFAELALVSGFTAKEIEKTELIFRWITESKEFSITGINKKFDKELPRRKGMLTAVAKAYKKDGLFSFACKKILNNQ